MATFDPNSENAMFATILQKLDDLHKTVEQIREQTTKTNGRVTRLEVEATATQTHIRGCSVNGEVQKLASRVSKLEEAKSFFLGGKAALLFTISSIGFLLDLVVHWFRP